MVKGRQAFKKENLINTKLWQNFTNYLQIPLYREFKLNQMLLYHTYSIRIRDRWRISLAQNYTITKNSVCGKIENKV